MGKPKLNELEKLMKELILPFYNVKRDAIPPIKPRRFENDVEHSWSVALLACSLAPEIDPGLDTGKIAEYAIVHDLIELYAGDTSPWHDEEFRESKNAREQLALEQLKTNFQKFPWIAKTAMEYEEKSTEEAKFVWAVDKIIILLLRYIDKGKFYIDEGITKQMFDNRLNEHREKAHAHPEIGDYYERLLECFENHPEYFAQNN